jgi:hypothetical protein
VFKISDLNLDNLIRKIEEWFKANFTKAVTQPASAAGNFHFNRVVKITRAWKYGEYWLVDVFVDYTFYNQKIRSFTFQVNSSGEILGFDLNVPHTITVGL